MIDPDLMTEVYAQITKGVSELLEQYKASAWQYISCDEPKLARESALRAEGVLQALQRIDNSYKRWKDS